MAAGGSPGSDDHEDRFDRIRDAAIEAEYETGEHEDTEERAKAHIVVRLVRMTIGTVVLILGLIATIGPGPGLLIVAAGLAILAKDVAWADRLLSRVQERLPRDEDGNIPRSAIVTMVVMLAAVTSASLYWFLRT